MKNSISEVFTVIAKNLYRASLSVSATLFSYTTSPVEAQNVTVLRPEREKLNDELSVEWIQVSAYIVSHPKASASVIASATGLAAIFSHGLTPEVQAILGSFAFLGGRFCLQEQNFNDCKEATEELAGYAQNIQALQSRIRDIDAVIIDFNRSRIGSGSHEIAVINNCSKEVKFGIVYQSLDEQWTPEKWWTIEPSQQHYISMNGQRIVSLNDTIYLYGEIPETSYQWSGQHRLSLSRFPDPYPMQQRRLQRLSNGDFNLILECPDYNPNPQLGSLIHTHQTNRENLPCRMTSFRSRDELRIACLAGTVTRCLHFVDEPRQYSFSDLYTTPEGYMAIDIGAEYIRQGVKHTLIFSVYEREYQSQRFQQILIQADTGPQAETCYYLGRHGWYEAPDYSIVDLYRNSMQFDDKNLVLQGSPTFPSSNRGGELYLSNNCSKPIKFLLRYRQLNGEWRTDGWWNLDAGEGPFLVNGERGERIRSDSSIFYYYAESRGGRWIGDYDRVFRGNTYPMRRTNLSPHSNGDRYLSLSCDN